MKTDLDKIKKDIAWLISQIKCFMSIFPAATTWSSNHSATTGNKYLKDTLVWDNGFIYKCLVNNNSNPLNNTFYWEKVGKGWLLQQEQADWNATGGPAFIRNKPTSLGGGTEEDPIFVAWLATDPLAPFLTEEIDPVFNAWLAENPLGDFLTSETDPVFSYWLTSDPLSPYYLASNPAGYITSSSLTPYLTISSASTTYFPIPTGTISQYIRGDGSLATFPTTSGGGGASISFYLNGSVSQGTFGGVAFREMDRTPILGAGTDFTINANGYIQSFITDAGVPNQLEIPAGNWNFETYFSASSGGGSPSFYVEVYKWDGATLSLIASSSANPEFITGGTSTDLYITALAVPQTTLLATDRLAVRIYVTNSGRTITLHTEDNHLCQVITTFSTGLTALNGLTAQVQSLAVGTTGTDFAINSTTATHTFNLPTASATNRGALSSADWIAFSNRKRQIVKDTTSVTITGTTANTLVKTYELPVGTLPTSGFLDLFMYSTRSGPTNAGHAMVLHINTTNNFATSTQIYGLAAAGNFNAILPSKATFALKNNLIIGGISNQGTGTNYLNSGTGISVACNNTVNSVWLFVSLTSASASNTINLQAIEITV